MGRKTLKEIVVSVLPVLLKSYKKGLFKQISIFLKKFSQDGVAPEKVTTRNNVFWLC